MAGEEFGQVS